MPSLIDFRRRIRSVKNTQQITKAMKMVAAARLRKAQERVVAARPYAKMLDNVLSNVAAAVSGSDAAAENPLLARRAEKRIHLILVTSDRGLAGAFNTNLIKAAAEFLRRKQGARLTIEAVGRKGRDFFRRNEGLVTGELVGVSEKPTVANAQAIAAKVIERYSSGEFDAVYLIYNEFKSVLQQRLSESQLLPVALPESRAVHDYIYEEPPASLLESLLPKYVETSIYRAMLESAASEFAARMTAMDAATSNATDVIERLTLHMNRVRQAAITKEIIEVVSGASALE
ncbi:MAG: ATP synthase F1 subunit gamma [Acidobacteria bacterium]|nr:ATP synthase F1 subunit gamma [Acidobacteriota bacterium]